MADGLLSTKYEPPPARIGVVHRPRLLARLDSAARVTLVSAPAGYGKTTLVSDWIGSRECAVAWLTLDEGDGDPAVLVRYLSASVRRAIPGLDLIDVPVEPRFTEPRSAVVPLLNALARLGESCTIVLDDFHLLTARPAHEVIAFLASRLPRQVRLILLGREDPPLPLARLRARGELTEIRAQDLRFECAEAAMLFGQTLALELPRDLVDRLTTKTEGWPAGLQLAGLSLKAAADPSALVASFGATDRYVLDYLSDEVIESLPPDTRRFLVQTSVLERMSASLCDAVTTRNDGVAMLASLERSNMFVTPLDDRREWYRYHALFADILRAELTPGERTELQRRAAGWFSERSVGPEAIRYALAAGSHEQAADLIERLAETALVSGEHATVLRWCDALPPQVLQTRPALRLIRAWVGNRTDLAETERLARQALDLLPPSDGLFRSLAFTTLGETIFTVDAAGGLVAFEAAADAYPSNGSALWAGLTFNRAQVEIVLGRRRAAEDRCRGALDEPRASSAFASGSIGFVHAGLAMALFDAAELPGALEHLVIAREECDRAGLRRIAFGTPDTLEVFALHLSGETERARRRLEAMWREAERIAATPVLRALPFIAAELARRDGDVAAIRRFAGELVSPADAGGVNDFERQVLAGLELALGRPAEALSIVEPVAEWQRSTGRLGRLIATLVLECRVLDALGRPSEAGSRLEEAVSHAATEEIRRPFIEERTAMKSWLPRLRGGNRDFVDDVLSRMKTPAAKPGLRVSASPNGRGMLVEPVTERELDVLRLVAAGLSNGEIAGELYIGLGTTKWHVHNLLEKLGAPNRVSLARRAHDLGLVRS